MAAYPDFHIEAQLGGVGIVGIDEAGRGCLAGPVVAAALILPCSADGAWYEEPILGIQDSKKLTAAKREALYAILTARCQHAVGMASVEEIDEHNILQATMLAMKRAAAGISNRRWIIVDGNRNPWPQDKNTLAVVDGDAKSLTIAAASIIAKVTRDRMMEAYSLHHPEYGWDENKGYGTTKHTRALKEFGPTILHRRTFIRNYTQTKLIYTMEET